jgi:hypothetical protein
MAISGLPNFASSFQALSIQTQSVNRTTATNKVNSLANNFPARSDESRDKVKNVDSDSDSDRGAAGGSAANPDGVGAALDVSA